jgi:hypothetical protein
MGNTPGGVCGSSAVHSHRALVDRAEEHGAEVDRPGAVVGLLQADLVLLERVGAEEEPGREARAV